MKNLISYLYYSISKQLKPFTTFTGADGQRRIRASKKYKTRRSHVVDHKKLPKLRQDKDTHARCSFINKLAEKHTAFLYGAMVV